MFLIGNLSFSCSCAKSSSIERWYNSDWMREQEEKEREFREIFMSSLKPHRGSKGIEKEIETEKDFNALN